MPSAALFALALAASPAPRDLVGALREAPPGGPRAAAAAGRLLGAPYLLDPLGEGRGADPDPRFRLDAFDCMTLVETAVALGSADTAREAARALDDVRYRGAPALASRNHEVLSQWIPANAAKGWIAEVTPQLAGPLARPFEKEFGPRSWALVRRAGRALHGVPSSRLPSGRFRLHVVAPADAVAIAHRLPQGALVFVVRADAPDRATPITHAGIVVQLPGGETLVRHATSTKGVERVIEETLERFLRRQARALPRRPLVGLSFFEVRDNRERVWAIAAQPRAR